MSQPLGLAFEQFYDATWTGGSVYIQNVLKALNTLDVDQRPRTLLFHRKGETPYNAVVDKHVEIPGDSTHLLTRIHRRLARKVGLAGPRPVIAKFLAANQVDVLFTDKIYPPMPVPLIGWIPDFQYLHLPEICGAEQVAFCTQLHRDVIRQSAVLIVSSNDVLKDLVAFSPEAKSRAQVVQFVAQIPDEVYATDPAYVCQKFSIPQRYFFLPNQFWKHKNHLVVVKALQILASRNVDVTVVCTGHTHDLRNPGYFASLLTEVAMAGVQDRFRLLGLVPRQDVLPLQRQAMAILQPSLFEGWSTSIEEAKSLGKRVVASDLDVHREQIPDADFFARNDPGQLADCLQAVAGQAAPGPDAEREAKARMEFPRRVKQFAQTFAEAAKMALKNRGK